MIRKLLLSAVLAAGAVAATPAAVEAAPPVGRGHDRDRDRDREHDRHGVRYEVLVRHRGHWDTYGTYRDRYDARRAAWMLERRGYDARIEVECRRW